MESSQIVNINKYLDLILCPTIGKGEKVCHYTDASLLDSILHDDNIELWATKITQLNDYSELYFGLDILKDTIHNVKSLQKIDTEKLFHRFKDAHVISFSTKPNSLPMWNTYAQHGVSLVFKGLGNNVENYYLAEINYNINEWIDKVNGIIDHFPNLTIAPLWVFAPYIIKHPAFEYESEVRIIVDMPEEIFMDTNGKSRYRIILPKSMLSEVVIGPSFGTDTNIKNEITHLLASRGYCNVRISSSNIPFRYVRNK